MRRRLAKFLQRYALHWGVITIVLYAAAIPMTVWIFPATTLLLTIVVLFGGFTSSVFAVASMMTDAQTDDRLDELEGPARRGTESRGPG